MKDQVSTKVKKTNIRAAITQNAEPKNLNSSEHYRHSQLRLNSRYGQIPKQPRPQLNFEEARVTYYQTESTPR